MPLSTDILHDIRVRAAIDRLPRATRDKILTHVKTLEAMVRGELDAFKALMVMRDSEGEYVAAYIDSVIERAWKKYLAMVDLTEAQVHEQIVEIKKTTEAVMNPSQQPPDDPPK